MKIELSKNDVRFILKCIAVACDSGYTTKIDNFCGKLMEQAKIKED